MQPAHGGVPAGTEIVAVKVMLPPERLGLLDEASAVLVGTRVFVCVKVADVGPGA